MTAIISDNSEIQGYLVFCRLDNHIHGHIEYLFYSMENYLKKSLPQHSYL